MLVRRDNIHFCRGSGRPVVETKPPSVVVRWRPPCLAWHEIGYTTSKMWLACHMSWHCLGICLFDMGDFARWLRTCLFVQNVLLNFLLRSTLLPCLTTYINVICFVFGVDDFSCDFPCDIKTNQICGLGDVILRFKMLSSPWHDIVFENVATNMTSSHPKVRLVTWFIWQGFRSDHVKMRLPTWHEHDMISHLNSFEGLVAEITWHYIHWKCVTLLREKNGKMCVGYLPSGYASWM